MRQILNRIKQIRHALTIDKSVKASIIRRFRKDFLKKDLSLLIYEREIIVVAVFLFITSCYQYKHKSEKTIHFNWKSYLKIFSPAQVNDFIVCSIKCLLEMGCIKKNKSAIQNFISFNTFTFKEAYFLTLIQKNSGTYSVSEEDLDFDVYQSLIKQSLQMAKNMLELKTKPENVINLISLIHEWKKSIKKIFGNKSEYVAYSFIYNLNLKS